jgi:hypothetical protein
VCLLHNPLKIASACPPVEPVLGTRLNYMAMRKVNTRRLELALAHKGMLLAAVAYNLQKLLRFTPQKKPDSRHGPAQRGAEHAFVVVFCGRGRADLRKRNRNQKLLES